MRYTGMLSEAWELLHRALRRLGCEAFRIIKPLENIALSRYEVNEQINPPPLFLIGAPRTGSTLIYQVITNFFEVNYTSNFGALFYHSLFIGMRLEKRLFGNGFHNNFISINGRTRGLRSPNECGKFWYRWFPKDRHFVGGDEFRTNELTALRRTILAVTKLMPRPFVFKNLNCGQRLQVLHKILPEALFIYCKRNPLYTAQSILEGRERVLGDKNKWWSVMPRNMSELLKLPYPEQVVKQVYYLQAQIEQDLPLFPEKQFIEVSYEALCDDLLGTLKQISDFWKRNGVNVGRREGALLPDLKLSERMRVSMSDFKALSVEINKLDWGGRL